MSLFDLPFVEAFERSTLHALFVDHPAGTGASEDHVVLDNPGGAAVHLCDMRNAVFEGCRGPLGPQVVLLGEVSVGVDDPDRVERVSHGNSPFCQRCKGVVRCCARASSERPPRRRTADHLTLGRCDVTLGRSDVALGRSASDRQSDDPRSG